GWHKSDCRFLSPVPHSVGTLNDNQEQDCKRNRNSPGPCQVKQNFQYCCDRQANHEIDQAEHEAKARDPKPHGRRQEIESPSDRPPASWADRWWYPKSCIGQDEKWHSAA